MTTYIPLEQALGAVQRQCRPERSPAQNRMLTLIRHELLDIPAADVAPVRYARWERDEDGDWQCTGCREVVAICEAGRERTYRKPYCPNCGARMDGDPDGLR